MITGGAMILLRTGTISEVAVVKMMLDTSITDVVTGGSVMNTVIVVVRYVTTPVVVFG